MGLSLMTVPTEKRRKEVERRRKRLRRRNIKSHLLLIGMFLFLGLYATVLRNQTHNGAGSTITDLRSEIRENPLKFRKHYEREALLVRQTLAETVVENGMNRGGLAIITRAKSHLQNQMSQYVRQGYNSVALFVIARELRTFALKYEKNTPLDVILHDYDQAVNAGDEFVSGVSKKQIYQKAKLKSRE